MDPVPPLSNPTKSPLKSGRWYHLATFEGTDHGPRAPAHEARAVERPRGSMSASEGFEALLSRSASRHSVPGCVLGILHEGRRTIACFGVVNTSTGVETVPDALF